jgi:hypothetical protein
MSRNELLDRAKQNALAYIDAGNLTQALVAMTCDMDRLPDNTREDNDRWGTVGIGYVLAGDAEGLRRWIESVT